MARGDRVRSLQGSHGYGLVLVVMVIPIAYALAVPDNEAWNRALTAVLFAVAIMITLVVVEARPRVQRIAAVLLVAVVVTAVIDAATGSKALGGVSRGIVGIMIALAPITLARGVTRHLRQEGQVTLDAVFGAVAIYLMLGAMFASIDNAVGALSSARILRPGRQPELRDLPLLQLHHARDRRLRRLHPRALAGACPGDHRGAYRSALPGDRRCGARLEHRASAAGARR